MSISSEIMKRINRNLVFDDTIEIISVPPTKVVSIKLPVDVIDLVDELWRKYGFRSRSEFIREAIIFYASVLEVVRKRQEKKDDEASGGLCLGLPEERCSIPVVAEAFEALGV